MKLDGADGSLESAEASLADYAAQLGHGGFAVYAGLCDALDLIDAAAGFDFPSLLNFRVGCIDGLGEEPVEELGGLLARQPTRLGHDLIESKAHGRHGREGFTEFNSRLRAPALRGRRDKWKNQGRLWRVQMCPLCDS